MYAPPTRAKIHTVERDRNRTTAHHLYGPTLRRKGVHHVEEYQVVSARVLAFLRGADLGSSVYPVLLIARQKRGRIQRKQGAMDRGKISLGPFLFSAGRFSVRRTGPGTARKGKIMDRFLFWLKKSTIGAIRSLTRREHSCRFYCGTCPHFERCQRDQAERSDQNFQKKMKTTSFFARVSPNLFTRTVQMRTAVGYGERRN